jgi:predicted RNase H-like HicB family nuclease
MRIERYAITLIWSQEDEAYLAMIPDLPGCAADGATVEEAIKNLDVVAQEWIETAKELGRRIPAPVTLSQLRERDRKADEEQHAAFEAAVKRAVDMLAKTAKSRTPEPLPRFTSSVLETTRRRGRSSQRRSTLARKEGL